jgi:hypothetical protein
MKKAFIILIVFIGIGISVHAQKVKSKTDGTENTYIVFEDERKTFEIVACWKIKAYIDKGQYGDENNIWYSISDFKYKVINKYDKCLYLNWLENETWGMARSLKCMPYDTAYVKMSELNFATRTMHGWVECNKQTGDMVFRKHNNLKFNFSDCTK